MKNQEIKFNNLIGNYSIVIGSNLLSILPRKIKAICPKTQKIAVIVDKNVPIKFISLILLQLKKLNHSKQSVFI